MNLQGSFNEYIKKHHLFQTKDHLLLAVSGGVDSVVMCELCYRAGYTFSIAHCNFTLRGEESDGDEQFVQQLAENYQAGFFVQHFATEKYAEENKLSIQVAARELRYNWFASIINPATGLPFEYLVTAHHANDNIETVLINFFKGTGIAGLTGIQPISGKKQKIVRPLLFAKKEDLHEFARQHSLSFRNDSSNESNKYTRNFFRNEIIPQVQKVFPKATDNLLDNIERFTDAYILYEQALSSIQRKLVFKKGNEYHLPVLKLLKTPALSTVLYELTKTFGFTPGQLTGITHLLHSESGRYIDSHTHRILRNRNWLIIAALNRNDQDHFLIRENDSQVQFSNFILSVTHAEKASKIEDNPAIAQLDAATIQFPLLLRRWKQGDYFYPLGMNKKKKLSRFFIDRKLSITEKENTWVVEMNKKIIWVAGQRIDDRFKLTGKTTAVLRLSLTVSK